MEISPQRVRTAEFKIVRKGADPDEVSSFLGDVADELERAQNQSTAMEARARAAVARLQELSESGERGTGEAADAEAVSASVDESETISRTLLLAQRTADTAVADARAQAEQILAEAKDEAARTLDSTREMSASMLEEARTEARRAGDAERAAVAGEVEALKARRDFLESDVQHLEAFLVDQRARLREAATSITDLVDRVPGGLGEVRAPLLSAADDDTGELDTSELTIATDIADESDEAVSDEGAAPATAGEERASDGPATGDAPPSVGTDDDPWAEDDPWVDDDPWADGDGDETVAMPVTEAPQDGHEDDRGEESFRFSFDDRS